MVAPQGWAGYHFLKIFPGLSSQGATYFFKYQNISTLIFDNLTVQQCCVISSVNESIS
jgi:alpha-ketoglutarate-dependent taurine dioxygenase